MKKIVEKINISESEFVSLTEKSASDYYRKFFGIKNLFLSHVVYFECNTVPDDIFILKDKINGSCGLIKKEKVTFLDEAKLIERKQ